jgi:hypothetical protein
MGIDILDLFFRLERTFGVKIGREESLDLLRTSDPPDVTAGELFAFVREKVRSAGTSVLDDELDSDALWPIFQRALSDSLGVERDEVTKDRWVLRELASG